MAVCGMRHISKLLAILLLVTPILSGCWDRREIEELAVVLGIGIDEAGPGAEREEEQVSHLNPSLQAPSTRLLRVTIQIAVPGGIPLGPGSGGGGGGGGDGGGGGQKSIWVVDGVGHTVDDALNSIQQRVASPLFFGHLRIIVIAESFARQGLENFNEVFRRNPEIRRMNWLLICQGKASDLMRASPRAERVPPLYLMNMMDHSVKMGRFPDDFLGIFWSSVSAPGSEGYLPYVKLEKEDTVLVAGLAYFRGAKLVGVTEPLEITVFMGIIGANPAGGQAFVRIPGTDEYILYGARNRKSSIKTSVKGGRPSVSVRIELEGNILEKANERVALDPNVIRQIENELEDTSQKAYLDLIRKTQEKQSDIFAFGEKFRAYHPSYWDREIKTPENWRRIYKNLPVTVEVNVEVRRIGMKTT